MKNQQTLIDKESRKPILSHLEVANSFWQRFAGLMFRKKLPPQFGLWILPCKSIHTLWMRVAIDVYFVDRQNKVIGLQENVKPWRLAVAPKGTYSVLETLAGSIQIPIGTYLEAGSAEN